VRKMVGALSTSSEGFFPMHSRITRSAVTVAGLGLALGALAVAPADAATVTQVRSGDLITALSDVRSAGHYEFLAEGIHVKTDDATSNAKVALYFPVSGTLPTTGSLEWFGTTNQPGAQIVFDKDQTTGNNNDFNTLVGEQANSTNPAGQPLTDWWYTGGTAKAATNGITCPSTSGGSGSDCHGTLAQWAAAVPTARVTAGGFSLGSGIQGDGVLRSITLGQTTYVFTDAPKAAVTVTAKAAKTTVKTGGKIKVSGTAKPVGPNAKVQLQVKKNGTWKTKAEKALAADGAYKLKMSAPGKPGTVKLRVVVPETNSTAFSKSPKVKVHVVK
jgi:hypothetical protein